ncbi:hypothetical protein [Maridesulfovibrio zosterae]|uniref:hypothetical protein n=1 Tax=Maridesulfovibrio zosterae TaxID=82171 RepID=UPI000423273B|nr:hypothetical protein [Maridesulfovibrio zosterae]
MSGLFTSLAVMMSPRGLAAIGNGAGSGGVVFLGLLVLAAFAALYTAKSIETLSNGKVRASSFDVLALGFLDSSRLFTLTVLAVSWLGIAGYVVNEIFFLWFPNLGASFFLLALAAAACIFSDDDGMEMFTFCLTLGFAAFVYISMMATQPASDTVGYPTSIPQIFSPLVPELFFKSGPSGLLNLLFLAVFVFLGFDLPLVFEKKARRATATVLLVFAGAILFVWGSLLIESPSSIAEISIPHLKVAKGVMGELGRALMGGTIVLGTIAALVAFFQIAGEQIKGIVAQKYTSYAPRVAALLLTVIICVLLATGWAGEDGLESFISAGLCFWFGTYALIDILHLIAIRRSGGGLLTSIFALIVFVIHFIAASVSALNIEFAAHFYYAILGMAVAGLVFGFSYYKKDAPFRVAALEKKALETAEDDAENGEPANDDESLNIVSYE